MNETTNSSTSADFSFTSTEHTFRVDDGTELFYRAWIPSAPTDRSLVIFHRGHEHSGRVQDVVESLGLRGFAIFAWDARGHGRSPGERGYAPSFARIVKDVDEFVGHIGRTYNKRPEDMVVLGQSVGAVAVATWVHDFAPRIRGMILAAPALRIKLYVPFAIPALRLGLAWRKGKKTFINSYVKPGMLTHDKQQARNYQNDPLIARAIAANVLVDLHDTSTRLINDAAAIRVPTLVLSAGADWVVELAAQRKLFERINTPFKRMRVFPGMYHDLMHERDRQLVLDEAREFIEEIFGRNVTRPSLLDAHRFGFTRDEYDQLREPLPLFSWKRIQFATQRISMKTIGRLSKGVELGWRTGFDSGKTLDYVYENEPRGSLGVGKWIDSTYVNSIGWRGIRIRRQNVEKLLLEAIELVRQRQSDVRVVDIASGPGRYILETIRKVSDEKLSVLLRDNVEPNLEAGRTLAKRLEIQNATFQLGDAFDEQSLALMSPTPNVAVVSGLYELFGDNEWVGRSLRGLSRALEPGGYLVYTGQPWHPQVEMIARVLTNRDGKPWVMRRRTQEEMDDLVRAAGFEKVKQEIDPWGIFTVSLSRRVVD